MFATVFGWLRRVRLRWLRWPLIGLAGLVLILLILWALVTVPAQLLGVDQIQEVGRIQDPAKRLDEVNGLRSTLVAVLAGLAVAAGAIVGALNFRETSRQNRAVLELQRRGQVTERFTKAVEQLGQRGDEKLDVRIGAVYALEQIARDSAELHWPIMEVLTAYLREHSPVGTAGETVRDAQSAHRLPADHQAIATVLGRRSTSQDAVGQRLDLHETDLSRADLDGADLRGANLRGANLAWAHLRRANLRSAKLNGANLDGANLGGAILSGWHLAGANPGGVYPDGTNLGGADLRKATLNGAYLGRANLTVVDLRWADLYGANLRSAFLTRANLGGANLGRADLREANLAYSFLGGADLARADLDQALLNGADLDGAIGLEPEQLAAVASPTQVQLDPKLPDVEP